MEDHGQREIVPGGWESVEVEARHALGCSVKTELQVWEERVQR